MDLSDEIEPEFSEEIPEKLEKDKEEEAHEKKKGKKKKHHHKEDHHHHKHHKEKEKSVHKHPDHRKHRKEKDEESVLVYQSLKFVLDYEETFDTTKMENHPSKRNAAKLFYIKHSGNCNEFGDARFHFRAFRSSKTFWGRGCYLDSYSEFNNHWLNFCPHDSISKKAGRLVGYCE